ncbi:hypothetical protein [Bradyrhizobium symbiodeficiens]|uniref:Uncharacterized protein n=1 Tax=Bradyrhizobium symbiodeficiens TaxID=1404367 RepID=A0A6G9AAQ9_9BRAD|nr:hypothetical protein [Bradyrhizobium symbiodeficiens]QIP09540.1 hypothetical protein HAV00_26285 [Bradyrhizobium symbiodeficiens]
MVRTAEFGVGETRKLMDNRRSSSIEALAGKVDPGAMAAKMGNTIDESRTLQKTYLPRRSRWSGWSTRPGRSGAGD